jgi:2-aminoethylphosphonate-pyruvate transaminase
MKRTLLLNPGPVNVSPRVAAALKRGDLCHREKEFADLAAGIRRKLLASFGIEKEFTSVLISGSGTAALEMGAAAIVSSGKSVLVIQNGVYGERIARIAATYHVPHQVLETPWGVPPDLAAIENAIQQNADIEVVAMVHHETTTGLLNPLKDVGEICQRHGKKFFVDGISSLAGDDFDFAACHVDMVVGTANKCIQGIPGVSFVLFRREDAPRLKNIPARSLYLNLMGHHQAQEAGETLFTPAVQAHYALDEALDELNEETVAGRIKRYRAQAQLLRTGFAEMGLKILLPENIRSNVLTALELPTGLSYPSLHDRLKERGFVIYAGQGNLGNQIFRVANMGDIRTEEFKRFLVVLSECISPSKNG